MPKRCKQNPNKAEEETATLFSVPKQRHRPRPSCRRYSPATETHTETRVGWVVPDVGCLDMFD